MNTKEKNHIQLTGEQVSSLCNDFGIDRVMAEMIIPATITGLYAHPMNGFMRALIASCPAFFKECGFTLPKHHDFCPKPTDANFCLRCGFPVEAHSNTCPVCFGRKLIDKLARRHDGLVERRTSKCPKCEATRQLEAKRKSHSDYY